MALFYLVRHGYTDWVDRAIAGRLPGIHLNALGREQIRCLGEKLEKNPFDCICAGPLERTCETAEPLALARGMEFRISEDFHEVDFGDWTGREVSTLSGNHWERFNSFRSGTRIPRGEMMLEVQGRMISGLEKLADEFPGGRIAVVSHADPIKTVIAHFAGMPLDLFLRLEISPASVSMLELHPWGPRIISINDTGGIPNARTGDEAVASSMDEG